MAKRWKQRPDGSNWGDFGPNDQFGRLNLLTPDVIRRAAREVREGIGFCLSLPLDYPGGNVLNPRRHPPQLTPTLNGEEPVMNYPMSRYDEQNTDVVSDDKVLITLQYSTQWDSLAHVGAYFDADGDGEPERVYYNGFRADEHVIGPVDYSGETPVEAGEHVGATALGVDNLAIKPLQGRGVLIDLERHFGRDKIVVDYDALNEIMSADGVEVENGDILLLRTGFSELILEMDREPDKAVLDHACAALDGRDDRLLRWITDSGIAAIAADNYAVEQFPARPRDGRRPGLPLHEHCLFKLGLPLGELWYLKELADWLHENSRSRCFLTAPPLRLPRAVGSPVSPIATV